MLSAITFDCWQTLLDDGNNPRVDALRAAGVAEALTKAGHPFTPDEVQDAIIAVRKDAHLRQEIMGMDMPPEEQSEIMLQKLQVPPSPELVAEVAKSYSGAILHAPPSAMAGAPEAVARLAERFRLGLICNTGATPGATVRLLLQRSGIQIDAFQTMFFSNENGIAKPNPAVFRRVLGQMGVAPSEAVHVGDHLQTDVRGALAVGMRAIWFSGVEASGQAEGVWVARDMEHLVSLVQEIAGGVSLP